MARRPYRSTILEPLDMQFPDIAIFSHLVDVQVLGLTLMVEGDNEVLQCLSKGQNVTLTCDIYGFPRLGIVFTRENVTIIPGGENFKRITKISPDQVSRLAIACKYTTESGVEPQYNGTILSLVGELVGMGASSTPHKDHSLDATLQAVIYIYPPAKSN